MATIQFIQQQMADIATLVDHTGDDHAAFSNYMLCKQHNTTVQAIRTQLVQMTPVDPRLRELLAQYSNAIEQLRIPSILIMEATVATEKKTRNRRLSVDVQNVGLELIDPTKEGSSVMDDENLSQLKKRLTDGRSKQAEKSVSMDEQLHEEEAKQDDLLKDMLQFVQGIKEGADAFNTKMNEENDILKAAEAGLQVTQKKINKSTKDLAKTINELSLFTALKIFAIIILMFLLSLLIISILPKL